MPGRCRRTLGLVAAACVGTAALAQGLPDYTGPAPGRIVDIGGRSLHLLCKGSGSPTVVIEPGSASPSALWWPVQDHLAARTRTCTYDRAGYGWSDPAPLPRSAADRAQDLARLLDRAGERGPWLLVAHSYGGLVARDFAHRRPEEVAGMVLVDAVEEESLADPLLQADADRAEARVRAHSDALMAQFPAARVAIAATLAEVADERRSMRQGPAPLPGLGALPLTVISRGRAGTTPEEVQVDAAWARGQARLATLASGASHVVATDSGHDIFLDEPELVTTEVERMLDRIRGRP